MKEQSNDEAFGGFGKEAGPAFLHTLVIISIAAMVVGAISGLTGFHYGGIATALISTSAFPLFFFLLWRRKSRPSN